MYGFHGQYLRVDLTTGNAERLPIEESTLRRFLGGVGLGSWLLHQESPPGVDPLAPEAAIVFAFSPLVGTPLTTSAKFAVVAKSPLTGFITDSLSSSRFAIHGKRLGVDAIVLVGACNEPSILVNDRLEATDLWGQSAAEVEEALRGRGKVAAIGGAGERLVRFATISNEGRHAGRGGLGAVLGSKRLKALVVQGRQTTPIADESGVVTLARDLSRRSLGPGTAKYRELGTVSNLATFNRLAALPTRNFQASEFERAAELSGPQLDSVREKVRGSCAACTIGCEHVFRTSDGGSVRLEYENLFALGPLCGIGNSETVLLASKKCDEWGLDTVSTGGTIAFAMECRERGMLPEAPEFGDDAAFLDTIDAIGRGEGLGVLLAEGSRAVALRLGGDAIDFAPQVKGLEIPGYEPRALQTLALGFAVGTRGADHNKSGAYELDFSERVNRLRGDPNAARLAIEPENRAALLDSLILCKFLRGALVDFFSECAEMLSGVTGWDVDAEELEETSARIIHLKKAFNIREGWQPADDTLPKRFLSQGLPSGVAEGAVIPEDRLREMIRAYNLARGWSEDGFLKAHHWKHLRLQAP